MKATGIVRRIDDLGRVVIPKEIRRTMRIREGDPLEIFTESDGTVIFKKYSPIGELGEFARQYAEALSKASGLATCISDKDTIIAVSGVSKKELSDKKVSPQLEKIMDDKTIFVANPNNKKVSIIEDNDNHKAGVVAPIIHEGDSIGSVVLLAKSEEENPTDTETKLVEVAAGFLGRTIE
ncbi:MAG: stage V sporulation protein T [Clostridia bacterium]|nr:stage V sporulation protein T [Clostridia bacterium]